MGIAQSLKKLANSWTHLGLNPSRDRNFSLHQYRLLLGLTKLHIQRIWGTLTIGVKQLECETDHSPPSRNKV